MISQVFGVLTKSEDTYKLVVHPFAFDVHAPFFYGDEKPYTHHTRILYSHEGEPVGYCFPSVEYLKVFDLLMKCPGIGGASALLFLRSFEPATILSFIMGENEKAFCSIKGIGAKTAKQAIVTLRPIVEKMQVESDVNYGNLVQALVSMGYRPRSAEEAATKVYRKDWPIEELVKSALMLSSVK